MKRTHLPQDWNRYQWHLRGRRSRRGRFLVLHVEKLESRSLLAGDLAALDDVADEPDAPPAEEAPSIVTMSATSEEATSDAGPIVDLSLKLTNLDGTPLTGLTAGQDFLVHVLAGDLRESPHGIFSAYLDLHWDSALASVSGPLQFADKFPNLRLGDASVEPGVLEEAGAFASFEESGAGAHEIFSVPMRAVGAGDLVITSDSAEAPINQVLAYGLNEAITPDQVRFGAASIKINAAPPKPAAASLTVETASAATTAPQDAAALASAAVVAAASQDSGGSVVLGEADAALQQLILQTLLPVPSAADSSAAPAENVAQDIVTPNVPSVATLLTGAAPSALGSTSQAADDSAESDEESGEESLDADTSSLNLL